MIADLSLDPKKETEEITQFIKNCLARSGFSKLVIGLSGGVDSAASFVLAIKAIGRENIYVGIFPYADLNREGEQDAQLIISKLGLAKDHIVRVDIKPFVDKISQSDSSIDDLRKGNIMVRTRMMLLYDLSKKYQALVLGTENKTEHLLGYFTRFGDEASDIEPIRHLYKTQVKQLASYLQISQKIIDKMPTAGMWQGQTDEGEFGFSYEQADQILYLCHDKKKTKKEIINSGFGKEVVEKVLNRQKENVFKHKTPLWFVRSN